MLFLSTTKREVHVRILLLSPSTARDVLSSTIHDIPYLDSKAFFAPHAIAAVAAVTPEGHEIKLHDEQMHGPVDALLEREHFDIIGITLVTNQFHRTLQIVEYCHQLNVSSKLVVGGIGVRYMMPDLMGKVDSVFIGEAEQTWPEFIEDVKKFGVRKVYRSTERPDMKRTPAPRWDLISEDIPHYSLVSVQTTRGCPHDCSFCDVIYTFGRKPRSKTIQQILEEVLAAERLGAKMVFFADDNFCGSKRYAKELLRELKLLNNSFANPLGFITQVDITIAEDEELLELMADSNLIEVQIGVESPRPESLQTMNKKHNLRFNAREAIQKIQSYGIVALCHLIVGSDTDDTSVFRTMARFLDEANITQHTVHPLTAPPGTRLWHQTMQESRLLKQTEMLHDKLDIVTNIIPKMMTRVDMLRCFADYWEQVYAPELYTKRALGFLNGISRLPNVKPAKPPSTRKFISMLAKLFGFYLFKVSSEHRRAFLNVFNATRKKAPQLIPLMIFVHTGYFMDYKRALIAADIARKQADWEESHPESVEILHDDPENDKNLLECAAEG
jgi:radical SAM superfamily enzyme YgiQ (UPF0313 family)